MDSQLFFYINLGFALFFLVLFWAGRRNRGITPTQLRLRNSNTEDISAATKVPPKIKKTYGQYTGGGVITEEMAVKNAKRLNVLFMYNGHDWDAYQVLGLPAGASLAMVTERYQNLIKSSDPGQLEFFESAYQAILKKV